MTFLIGSGKLIWTGCLLGLGFYMAKSLTNKIDRVLAEPRPVVIHSVNQQYAN